MNKKDESILHTISCHYWQWLLQPISELEVWLIIYPNGLNVRPSAADWQWLSVFHVRPGPNDFIEKFIAQGSCNHV